MINNKLNKKNILIYLFLVMFGLLMISPFVWMISVSLERMANLQPPFPPKLIPEQPSFFNYKIIFENGYILRAFNNSLLVSFGSVTVSTISALLAGYAFSKGQFKGKKVMLMIILSTMMIPLQTRLIPMHQMFYRMGLLNTFWPIILPNLCYGLGVLLSKQFIDSLPNSIREAAQIDGANEFYIFLRIYLPLMGPISATMVILSFMSSWNSFLWPLIVLTNQKLQTIPIYLSTFSQEGGTRLAGLTMSTACISILPILVVFLIFQKQIVKSVALSGLKG